jgi:hypothetical protein
LFSSVPYPAGLVHVAFGLFFIYNIIPQQGLPLLYLFQKKLDDEMGIPLLCDFLIYYLHYKHNRTSRWYVLPTSIDSTHKSNSLQT